jgi:hypothetical protein
MWAVVFIIKGRNIGSFCFHDPMLHVTNSSVFFIIIFIILFFYLYIDSLTEEF